MSQRYADNFKGMNPSDPSPEKKKKKQTNNEPRL